MRKGMLLLGLIVLVTVAFGTEVKVNLFTGSRLTSVTLNHLSGRYMLISNDDEIATLSHGDEITLMVKDSDIIVTQKDSIIASAKSFSFVGVGMQNSFSLNASGFPTRFYEDHLTIRLEKGAIKLINQIDLEKYVGGVVQAEAGGSTSQVTYFMVQAMVSRTYAMRLIQIHGSEFCLTDDVNNQVYKGKPVKPEILEAVARTSGMVIIDDDSNLINAVFHSNSGGFTMASEDVWMTSLPYLQPVQDSFSIGQRSFLWTFSMPILSWLDYLEKTWGFPVYIDSIRQLALNYNQVQRSKLFLNNIPLAKVRSDLNLKSTCFNISVDHDMVVFTGKGYGHGVGLSQEGAIRMADLGYTADDILKHYYTGVSIRQISDLQSLATLP